MKKLLSWLLVLTLLCSLGATALAGGAEYFAGVYTLTEIQDDEDPETAEEMNGILPTLAAMGMCPTLTVREDSTAVLELQGKEMELQIDFDNSTAVMDGSSVDIEFVNDEVTITNGSTVMKFSRDVKAMALGENGPFDYYLMTALEYADGRNLEEELAILAQVNMTPGLTVFRNGYAKLDLSGSITELAFNFDDMTVTVEDEVLDVTLEDGVLEIHDADGSVMRFQQADPGRVGLYAMTGLVTEDDGDLTEQLLLLASMDMTPTLRVAEDGSAVLSVMGDTMEIQLDFDRMIASAEGEEIPFTYEYGRLVISEGGQSMTFERIQEPADADGEVKAAS